MNFHLEWTVLKSPALVKSPTPLKKEKKIKKEKEIKKKEFKRVRLLTWAISPKNVLQFLLISAHN